MCIYWTCQYRMCIFQWNCFFVLLLMVIWEFLFKSEFNYYLKFCWDCCSCSRFILYFWKQSECLVDWLQFLSWNKVIIVGGFNIDFVVVAVLSHTYPLSPAYPILCGTFADHIIVYCCVSRKCSSWFINIVHCIYWFLTFPFLNCIFLVYYRSFENFSPFLLILRKEKTWLLAVLMSFNFVITSFGK